MVAGRLLCGCDQRLRRLRHAQRHFHHRPCLHPVRLHFWLIVSDPRGHHSRPRPRAF
ncbi:hypothetical protein DsansV1_C09g0089861 [Dioscorea sansibarensis]